MPHREVGEVGSVALEQSVGDMRARQSGYDTEDWRTRLKAFIASQGEVGEIIDIKRPSGGSSAASMIFSVKSSSAEGTLVKRYVARLTPEKSFWAEFDIVEQFNVQRSLHAVGLPVPKAVWLDEDGSYLGRPGYIMAFDSGGASTPAYFTDGPMSHIDSAKRFRMLKNMTGVLADMHNKADPWVVKSLSSKGRGEAWIEREINMWFDLIDYGRPEMSGFYQPIRDWLVESIPEVTQSVLVHGDFQGSNVLWNEEEISAILDFEVCRVGPRESDVAYQCNQDIVSAQFFGGLDVELPSLSQRASWYEQASGVKLNNLDYHYVRAVFQLSCGIVSLARHLEQNLMTDPTPFMDFSNRRLMALLPKHVAVKAQLPMINHRT